jgi:hypothetical protein
MLQSPPAFNVLKYARGVLSLTSGLARDRLSRWAVHAIGMACAESAPLSHSGRKKSSRPPGKHLCFHTRCHFGGCDVLRIEIDEFSLRIHQVSYDGMIHEVIVACVVIF